MNRTSHLALCILALQVLGPLAGAQNLLANAGFETGDRTDWFANWTPDQAGALATPTAARTGSFELWIYSAAGFGGDSYSELMQFANVSPGDVFRGSAHIRTPGAGWASGSFACVRIGVVTETGWVLYESPRLTTENAPYSDPFVVTTPPAPPEARSVYYWVHVHKPEGVAGQAVANFDDCVLERFRCGDCVGDVDLDGQDGLADLVVLLRNFGTAGGATCSDGDVFPAEGDGVIDLPDLAELLIHFGATCR